MESTRKITASLISPEFVFTASRSGGPGGQNVNKVNSKVTLRFDVAESRILTAEEKHDLILKLAPVITKDGVLMLTSQESRSQEDNKATVIAKLDVLLQRAFQKRKKRKPTKPSKAAKAKRVDQKKRRSETKKWRRNID
jgi:ribosome-associated protein